MIAGKSWIRNWINEHPAVWEFILFNVLSNVDSIGQCGDQRLWKSKAFKKCLAVSGKCCRYND